MPTHIVRVERVLDIQAGVDFAQKYNLRLILRNTSYDSTGRYSEGDAQRRSL